MGIILKDEKFYNKMTKESRLPKSNFDFPSAIIFMQYVIFLIR